MKFKISCIIFIFSIFFPLTTLATQSKLDSRLGLGDVIVSDLNLGYSSEIIGCHEYGRELTVSNSTVFSFKYGITDTVSSEVYVREQDHFFIANNGNEHKIIAKIIEIKDCRAVVEVRNYPKTVAKQTNSYLFAQVGDVVISNDGIGSKGDFNYVRVTGCHDHGHATLKIVKGNGGEVKSSDVRLALNETTYIFDQRGHKKLLTLVNSNNCEVQLKLTAEPR